LFFARAKTREFLFARFGASCARAAIPTERLPLTGFPVTTKRFTLTGFTVSTKRFTLTGFPVTTKRFTVTGFPVTTKRLPLTGFTVSTKRFTVTVARGSFATRAIATVFGRAKTARTRFAR
jgi:hypothetical protein